MKRLLGLAIFIGGLMLVVLGLSMWRNPQVSWQGFIDVWSMIIDGIARLFRDPFALLGVVVLVTGSIIAYNAVKRIIRP
ncbi:MAG: hypothetical protein V1767_05010 [Chloroflexota bacterium]